MRISLLDPKWKEQKQIEEERRKDSNVAQEGEINRNLKQFAARRTDIFGDDEVGIGEVVGNNSGDREKVREGARTHHRHTCVTTAKHVSPPPCVTAALSV